MFCYVNSVFAPGLDEGVGGLWRVSGFLFVCLFLFLFLVGWGGGGRGSKGDLRGLRGFDSGLMRWVVVFQDGRSAYCVVFHDACFWMRWVEGPRGLSIF